MEEIQEKNTKNVSQKIPQAIKNALDNFKGKVFDVFMNTDFGNSGFGREKSQENQQLEIIEIDYDIDKEEYEKEFENFEKKYKEEFQGFNKEFHSNKDYDLKGFYYILYNLKIQGYDLFDKDFLGSIILNGVFKGENKFTNFIDFYVYACDNGLDFLFDDNYQIGKFIEIDTKDYIGFIDEIKKYREKGFTDYEITLCFVFMKDYLDKNLFIQSANLMEVCKQFGSDNTNIIYSELINNNGTLYINEIKDLIEKHGKEIIVSLVFALKKINTLGVDNIGKVLLYNMFNKYFEFQKEINKEVPSVVNDIESIHKALKMKFGFPKSMFGVGGLKIKGEENLSALNIGKMMILNINKTEAFIDLYNKYIEGKEYSCENEDILLLLYGKLSYIESKVSEEIKTKINSLVDENKDKIYDSLKTRYLKYLESGIIDDNFRVLSFIIKSIGVGNLSQIHSILSFIQNISEKSNNGEDNLKNQLNIFEQKTLKLSNKLKTDFYNISNYFLNLDTKMVLNYLVFLNSLDQEQIKYFIENIYGNHNILLEFDKKSKSYIKNLLNKNKSLDIKQLSDHKNQIQEKIIKSAKDKFGIIKMPEVFSEENIEDIKQFSIYFANITERNEKKSKLIGIALGLKLNGLWEKFRAGEEINFEILFDTETSIFAKTYKEKLKELFISIFNINGLQAEVSNVMIGSSETIDQKLLNIKTHIKEQLTDKDAYDEETYKIFELYKVHGGKLGKALSLKFQSFIKKIEIDEESQKILSELGEINSAEQIKAIQEKVDLVKGVIGINEDLEKLNLDQDLNELNKLLIPSQKIIDVFIKLGEDFSSDSGAIALSQDVSYLVDLVQKDKQKSAGRILSEEEYKQAILYLNFIKEKLDSLYKYLFKIEEIFINKFCEKDKKSGVGEEKKLVIKKIYDKLEILKSRIESLKDEILKGQNKENGTIEMMTTLTSSLTDVIANIRGCLGCQKKEINNDTNLRFTAPNEFFIISRKSGNKKSFADQPVTLLESDRGFVFIIDTLRGETKTPDILVAHILVLLKKIKKLNTKNISILFPPNAAGGVGITAEYIKKRLKEEIDDSIEVNSDVNFQVKVPNQDYYDPYYEWGNFREKKDKVVNGIEIKLI